MSITVNGELVEQALILQEMNTLRQRYGEALNEQQMSEKEKDIATDAKENAIERVLLAQEARKSVPFVMETDVDERFMEVMRQYGATEVPADIPADEVKKMKDAIADGLRLEKYFAQVCKDVAKPTDDECKAYYDGNPELFQSPELVHASHIVRQPARGQDFGEFSAEMLNLRTQAHKGADFSELASRFSQCEDKGGDLGWFPRGSMVESFEKVVFALEPGQVSDVFRTEFGYHIAKVHERRPSGPVPFKTILRKIRELLFEQRKNDAIGLVVDRLRKDSKIVETPDETKP